LPKEFFAEGLDDGVAKAIMAPATLPVTLVLTSLSPSICPIIVLRDIPAKKQKTQRCYW
jgi:hypothetical protein